MAAKNALLIILDTVRANATGTNTETINKVANNGASFSTAITTYPWSLSAHASIFTGHYTGTHNATPYTRYLDENVTTLAESLSAADIRTGIFTANMFLSDAFGMARGYETQDFMQDRGNQLFSDAFAPGAFTAKRQHHSGISRVKELAAELSNGPIHKNIANALYYKYKQGRGPDPHPQEAWDEQAIDSASTFITEAADADDRFFATVNLMEAHAPWEYRPELLEDIGVTPSKFGTGAEWQSVASRSAHQWQYAAGDTTFTDREREMLVALYEAWTYRADREAGRLLDVLESAGVLDDTLVVVTSDHGEVIAEDDILGHTVSVHDDMVRVPLALQGPTIPNRGVVDEPVSLTQLRATIESALGVKRTGDGVLDTCGWAFTETYGNDESRIEMLNEEYLDRDAIQDLLQKRYALYTSEGRIEFRARTESYHGVTELKDELDDAIRDHSSRTPGAGVDRADPSTEVAQRLRNLGYAE